METTIPPDDIIEFGAIVLSKTGLFEVSRYSTLVYSEKVTEQSVKANGIISSLLADAPKFEQVADIIFELMDGKIWIGHNILSFDRRVLKSCFEKIGKRAPVAAACLDTLHLFKKVWGKRCGDLKMATLGRYFGLGEEKHRAIEDCEMTIEVFKKIALTLLLEQFVGVEISTKIPSKEIPQKKSKTSSKKREEVEIETLQKKEFREKINKAMEEKR